MSVLTHELQHAVHWAADADEESWLNEGLSELASGAAGHWSNKVADYLRIPGTSLTQWPGGPGFRSPSYGGANLFVDYLAEHYGGERLVRELVKEPADGLESVDLVLERLGEDATSLDVFRDWVVANYLNEPDGRYSSQARKARSAVRVRSTFVNLPKTYEREVSQFGADYYVVTLPADELVISFNGDPAAELFPVAPHSGEACWWSNDGDSINTTSDAAVRPDRGGHRQAAVPRLARHRGGLGLRLRRGVGGQRRDVDDPRNDANVGRKPERHGVRPRLHRRFDRLAVMDSVDLIAVHRQRGAGPLRIRDGRRRERQRAYASTTFPSTRSAGPTTPKPTAAGSQTASPASTTSCPRNSSYKSSAKHPADQPT